MAQGSPPRRCLDQRTWALAALGAFAERGLGAVAVEPLARSLGTTKGSFYWHFADRRALLVAALELYEQEGTEAVIATLGGQSETPASSDHQLHSLFALVFREEGGDAVYHALLANDTDPDVAPVLTRITTRRLDYLIGAMIAVGHAPVEAHDRAVLAYTTWLGLVQTERAMGGRLFSSKLGRAHYLGFVEQVLLGPATRRP